MTALLAQLPLYAVLAYFHALAPFLKCIPLGGDAKANHATSATLVTTKGDIMRGLIITSMLALGLSLLATQGSARTLVAIDPATAAALDDSKALVDALTMISDDAATLSDQASAAGDDYAASVLSNLAESTSATASDVERSIVISIEHGISMTKVAIYVSRLSADFDLVASDASDVSSVTDLLSGELQAAADLHDALSADVGDGRGRPGRPTRAGRNGTTAQASTSGMPSGSGASNASANGMGLSTNLQ